ncbi:MAG: bifunctional methylenetetrahydrofolate dehydrogenase/methenyltetrahydrofolate cyclohydrolase FolD [Clostridia bacterium]|nr:bifunctional methylenetetrahydrofolate dehydrogenase/methenyltetrahydrofolate cyclohydrolase FolD [Clostridia bacterium]MBQ9480814.1 bifunctional methylenetetrahydrofolate dehydrogenase/methenyltetrahydrofolate cyclohydrolase FolD [Clostridia bacterium]
MKIIDGKALSAKMRSEIAEKIKGYAVKPCLAVVMVGEDPASAIYVRNKGKACSEVGMVSVTRVLPENASQAEVEAVVGELAADDKIHGILVQLPLPAHIDADAVLSLIPTEKDVDGFSPQNVGNMLLGKPCLSACTPSGAVELIKYAGVEISGKHAVVVGRSNIVGKPAAILLLKENATVTVCHSKTADIAAITKQADILVVAVGKPKFITADMVKEGATVIDVGINRIDGKVVGDVDFESVSAKAGAITPVPGGVGPMTITMLLKNTLSAYERKYGIE